MSKKVKKIAEYRTLPTNEKGLEEKRTELMLEMNSIIEKAKLEKRAISDEESGKFDQIKKEVESIDKTLRAIEEERALQDKKPVEKTKKEDAEVRAFENYIRGTVSEQRADVNLTTTDNGAVIPSSIANKIIKKIYDICPIYQLATKYNIKGTLNIPYYDESTQSITMSYSSEFTDLTSTSGKFTSIELKGYLAGALSKVSKSLVNNSQFDIVSFVVNAMAESASKWIENELLNGTTDKVAGLSGVTQVVTTASSIAITSDECIDLQEAVPDAYQANAFWIMNKDTRKAIRKLKNSVGDYILNKDSTAKWGYTLFGKDVYTSDNMSKIAAGKNVMFYGDMSGLAVKVAEDISIEILRELFAGQHAIGVVGWLEIDSKVENAQKIAKMVMKSV